MTSVYIGIDVGTFESKGVLVDADGRVRAEARRRHGISTPAPGWVEQDPDTVWWADLCAIAQELSAAASREGWAIDAVGCSAIGPCVVAMDERGDALRPAILYGVDTRAELQIDRMNARLGEDEIFRRAGNSLSSQSAGPKIAWIVDNEPEVARRTRWYGTSQTYLVRRLTGSTVIDHATAGYFHPFYDLRRQEWTTEGLDDIISVDQLPELAWSTAIAGVITEQASAHTGLPVGVPVIVGTTDAPAEAIAAGVLGAGEAMLMYGSSTYIIQVTDEPITDSGLWSAPYVFSGTSVLAAGTSTAGTATRWLCELLGLDDGRPEVEMFGAMMELARSAPSGAGGAVAVPHLSGERTPVYDSSARGMLFGLSLRTGRAEFARAVIEGVAHSVAHALSRYDELDRRPHRIASIGGGTSNDILLRAVSDLTGHRQLVIHSLGAAFGDAALAALAVGGVSDRTSVATWATVVDEVVPLGEDEPARKALRHDHDDYIRAYEQLAPTHRERSRHARGDV